MAMTRTLPSARRSPSRERGVTPSLIAAVAANGIIGNRGALPWKLPDDMARFRALTMGHAVIMGRSTFESMGKPLRGRRNIVLSRNAGLQVEGCCVVHSPAEALRAASGDEEPFVIGGASVYAAFLPGAQRLYITWIDVEVPGDTLFPGVDWAAWRVTREIAAADKGGPFPHRFVDYERAPA
jgi:dihydrofolate reductase